MRPAHNRLVSVVIPARNEGEGIVRCVRAVLSQRVPGVELELLVVDDGSTDATSRLAEEAGARVLGAGSARRPGSPGAARNIGARAARGDPIVFLDADCEPRPGWLAALLDAHDRGAAVVGGSLGLPGGLSVTARCDYYCGWYFVHPPRPAGEVPHHPPPNLSVRREAFLGSSGFREELPVGYTNEERAWQAEVRRAGGRIHFEPRAVALHYNRPGLWPLLRRNYRWASTGVQAKGPSGSARMAALYRRPLLLILASPLLVPAHTLLIIGCWLRARVYEPLWLSPLILLSRVSYVAGVVTDAARAVGRGSGRAGWLPDAGARSAERRG